MFEKAMHSNGISYDIIRKKLPVINEEIAKILSNIVGFEIFFEDDGKKLDILIKHPKYDPRPLELCSGAEKSLAAMAIRLALTKITSLPVSDLFILDEPATSLDEENMEGFMRIIDMLKSQFKTIILISHLPELKDVADLQITIDNIDGYAHVEV
jgi:DNA repair exonuclease SbcCD ATPase subunit